MLLCKTLFDAFVHVTIEFAAACATGEQSAHEVAPELLYLLAAQLSHSVAALLSESAWPATQSAQLPEPAAAYWPAPQLMHEAAPVSLYWPATQLMHEVAPVSLY